MPFLRFSRPNGRNASSTSGRFRDWSLAAILDTGKMLHHLPSRIERIRRDDCVPGDWWRTHRTIIHTFAVTLLATPNELPPSLWLDLPHYLAFRRSTTIQSWTFFCSLLVYSRSSIACIPADLWAIVV